MGRSRWDNEMKTRAEHPKIVQLVGKLRQCRLRVIALPPGERYRHCVPELLPYGRNKNQPSDN